MEDYVISMLSINACYFNEYRPYLEYSDCHKMQILGLDKKKLVPKRLPPLKVRQRIQLLNTLSPTGRYEMSTIQIQENYTIENDGNKSFAGHSQRGEHKHHHRQQSQPQMQQHQKEQQQEEERNDTEEGKEKEQEEGKIENENEQEKVKENENEHEKEKEVVEDEGKDKTEDPGQVKEEDEGEKKKEEGEKEKVSSVNEVKDQENDQEKKQEGVHEEKQHEDAQEQHEQHEQKVEANEENEYIVDDPELLNLPTIVKKIHKLEYHGLILIFRTLDIVLEKLSEHAEGQAPGLTRRRSKINKGENVRVDISKLNLLKDFTDESVIRICRDSIEVDPHGKFTLRIKTKTVANHGEKANEDEPFSLDHTEQIELNNEPYRITIK